VGTQMTATPAGTVERALATLLDSLALLLISLEVTPARLDQISRTSFVKAGALKARKRSSGRPHLARIASVTGLSRSEVKRIVAQNFEIAPSEPECWPRALRVLHAWTRSKRFISQGRPRRLKISGPGCTFAALCRAHSGDIPPRVILAELEAGGRVQVNGSRTHVSVSSGDRNRRQSKISTDSLEFAASFLRCALSEEALLVKRRERIAVSPAVPSGYVEGAITGRVNDLLDQLPTVFPNKKGRRGSVDVFALVGRERATRQA
jgi:hypothetical protein